MAGIYSSRFVLQSQGGSASFTCPTGFVAVVRGITAVNRGTTAALAKLVLVGSPNVFLWSAALAPVSTGSPAAGAAVDIRFVFTAGQQIAAVSDAVVDLTASGYLFSS